MHFLQMPFALGPILFTEEAGGMTEVQKVLFGVNLIYSNEVLIEDPGQDIYRVLFVALNWTNPVKYHRCIG